MEATVKLYEVADALEAVAAELVENGGELTPELEARLEALGGKFEAKLERVLLHARNIRAAATAAAAEAERLSLLASARANAADRLHGYAKLQMERANVTKVETPLVAASIVRNGRPSIKWARPSDEIPEAFRKVTVSLDGTAAYEQFKKVGRLPEGFEVQQGTHLRVR